MIIRCNDHIYKSQKINETKHYFSCKKCGDTILVHDSIECLRKLKISEDQIYAYLNESKDEIISIYGNEKDAMIKTCKYSDDEFIVKGILT